MTDRELVLEAVRKMPDPHSCEDIVEGLRVLAEMRERVAEADAGIGLLPQDTAVGRVDAWKTQAGE